MATDPPEVSSAWFQRALAFTPKTGHVTRQGAVIGRVEEQKSGELHYIEYKFGAKRPLLTASNLPELLRLVRKHEDMKE